MRRLKALFDSLLLWLWHLVCPGHHPRTATRIAVYDGSAEQEVTMGRPLSNTAKSRTLRLVPQTAGGQPAKVQPGSMVGTSSDESKVTVEVAADGLSAKLIPVAGQVSDQVAMPDGTSQATPIKFTFTGDADMGQGVRAISGEYECVLAEEEATGLVVEEGEDEV